MILGPAETQATTPLDPVGLRRIESIHRGFLYQHLFAVGCLLRASEAGTTRVVVEVDEDVELSVGAQRVFIQVKTRSVPLRPADVAASLDRFDELRRIHGSDAVFAIASNVPPRSDLAELAAARGYPDSTWLYPGHAVNHPSMPPPWSTLDDALAWCVERAVSIPFRGLAAETLVWKLASVVQYACTGHESRRHHRIDASELPTLFEQFVSQVQAFPPAPKPYRPHDGEPSIDVDDQASLVIGLSGAGKTSWAAAQSAHYAGAIAYFDIGETPESALFGALARELLAQFSDGDEARGSVLAPGLTGLESLRALDLAFRHGGRNPIVVFDNSHRVRPDTVIELVRSTGSVRWVFLAQPSPSLQALEAGLGLTPILLVGWSMETLARHFGDAGMPIDANVANRLRSLTGGLPLVVQNACQLARVRFGGDVSALLAEYDEPGVVEPPHTALYRAIVATLSAGARDVMVLMGTSDVELTLDEVVEFAADVLALPKHTTLAALRDLERWGLLPLANDRRLLLHDALRATAKVQLAELSDDMQRKIYQKLIAIYERPTDKRDLFHRRVALLRALPKAGQLDVLIEVATTDAEYFAELGLTGLIKEVATRALGDAKLDDRERFWLFDTLAFWAVQDGNITEAQECLAELRSIVGRGTLSDKERANLLLKELLVSGSVGDVGKARCALEQLRQLGAEALSVRIAKYNFAVVLYHNNRHEEGEALTDALMTEYLDLFGIEISDFALINAPELNKRLVKREEDAQELKRLADVMDLHTRFVEPHASDRKAMFELQLLRLWTSKAYAATNALSSFARTGIDYAEAAVALGDPEGSRQYLESNLLPMLREHRLFNYFVGAYTAHALALVHCGADDEARKALAVVQPFVGTLSPEDRAQYEIRTAEIEQFLSGVCRPLPPVLPPTTTGPMRRERRKVGPNEKCPCGSGRKYKKCHGKAPT
jgi:hypothetical protein